VDTAVEGTHFRRTWLSFEQLGYRSLIAALSDLAAMGASARATLTSLIVPADVTDADLYALADGCAQAAREHSAPVIGGNLSRGTELSLTTTVVGSIGGRATQRSGANVGDVIYVTGTLGAAALGLQCLITQRTGDDAARFINRWRRPTARIDEGRALLGIATAAIDVSDGLLQDLSHLCRSSNTGAVIDTDAVPLSAGAATVALALGLDATQLALTGGEDYELLFSAPRGVSIPIRATAIGEIRAARQITLRESGRERAAPTHAGFQHFE
jgi:thiamine-monophosphate kinase